MLGAMDKDPTSSTYQRFRNKHICGGSCHMRQQLKICDVTSTILGAFQMLCPKGGIS
jgi:hypothetical protein